MYSYLQSGFVFNMYANLCLFLNLPTNDTSQISRNLIGWAVARMSHCL